jgi:protein TonB
MLSKNLSGVYAVAIYFTLVGLFLGFFNQHKPKIENIHYVKHNDNKIEVGLTSAPKKNIAPITKPKIKSNPTPKHKTKTKSKPKKHITKKKIVKKKKILKKPKPKKKIVKKKVIKKEPVVKKREVKKVDMKKLFSNIKDTTPKTQSNKDKNRKITSSMKNVKNRDRGIINKYFAKVEETLYYWPALSQFAGDRAEVWLKIEQDGSFVFKILKPSNNPDFNSGLIQYLKQLQRVGFARHQYKRPLEARVEFEAKE